MFGQVTLEVEAAEPHHIVRMDMRPMGHPPEFAIEHLSETELIAALHERMDEQAAQGNFAGAVVVAKDGKPVFEQAYGLADREKHIPNTLKTRFRNGSMNKMFTAVATLQLVQAGKLKLDDPVGKYLTDYPNKDVATKVTISELLSHTGGTGDFFGPEFDQHRLELRTHADYVKLFGNRPPKFEPGSRFEYSNYGFLLLGNIIEKVTGESYYDYVREHVYEPAGMTSTGSQPEDEKVADRSVGYTKDGDRRVASEYGHAAVSRDFGGRWIYHGRRSAGVCECARGAQAAGRALHGAADDGQGGYAGSWWRCALRVWL